MMKRTWLTPRAAAAALSGVLLAAPAGAFDIGAMTEAERDAFGEAVRGYLMENPEVLVEAITVLEQRQFEQQAGDDQALIAMNAEQIFTDGHSWVGGNSDGDVTVVVFMDYRCGFCRQAHPETEALVAGDGNIRYVLKEFPILGEQSLLASRFAISVHQMEGDEAYKRAHDALMEMRGDVTIESLQRLATELGHDGPSLVSHMNTEAVNRILRENAQLAEQLRISGTPTFIVDDQMVRGYVPLEGMEQIVAAAREE
ncbi:DsbA family protein [Halodurantibacterium flavum]|uniref:DsbA family protein n=1 Tax=Halodurantibacterium flavum TaxID=1382802 RepID=A0ABW4S8M7_9RHOB